MTSRWGRRNTHDLDDVLVKSRVEVEDGTQILAKIEIMSASINFHIIKLKVLFAKV